MRIPAMLLTQTCQISPLIGITPSGPKYGTAFSAKCRLEDWRKKRVNSSGKVYFTSGKLFLLPNDNVLALDPDTKITLNNRTYILTSSIPHRGLTLSHVECEVV